MFNKKIEDDSEHSFWISYADMLTGFLISFMVIALLLASKVKDCPTCPPPCPGIGSAANTQRALIKDLWEEFKNDDIIVVDTATKTIRFRQINTNSSNVLFEIGKTEPNILLKSKLSYFIPKYLKKLNEIRLNNKKVEIKEIRIEGHTDDLPSKEDPNCIYLCNYRWATERAMNVLKYFVEESSYFKDKVNSNYEEWSFFMNRMMPCGYAYSKPLDIDGNPTIIQKINGNQSRRIEFRVIIEDKPK